MYYFKICAKLAVNLRQWAASMKETILNTFLTRWSFDVGYLAINGNHLIELEKKTLL